MVLIQVFTMTVLETVTGSTPPGMGFEEPRGVAAIGGDAELSRTLFLCDPRKSRVLEVSISLDPFHAGLVNRTQFVAPATVPSTSLPPHDPNAINMTTVAPTAPPLSAPATPTWSNLLVGGGETRVVADEAIVGDLVVRFVSSNDSSNVRLDGRLVLRNTSVAGAVVVTSAQYGARRQDPGWLHIEVDIVDCRCG